MWNVVTDREAASGRVALVKAAGDTSMKFREITSRITGLSCPIFGVSWNPPEASVAVARRIVTVLEDKRVLYAPDEVEVPEHCVQSILEIRRFLTQELAQLDGGDIADCIRALRSTCRKFLDTVQREGREYVRFGRTPGHYASWVFMDALGQLRAVFGVHLAQMAARYGLDVEDGLASIFPAPDSGDGDES